MRWPRCLIVVFSSTTLPAISLSMIAQSWSIDVNGPMYAFSMRVRSPMIAGPLITLLTIVQPGCSTTRPCSFDASSTVPPLRSSPQHLQDDAVRREQVVVLAGVDPVALDDLRAHVRAVVEQPLDRVRDLQLAARRRLDAVDRLEDAAGEHVDADDGEVARRILRLLDRRAPGARRRTGRRRTRVASGTCFSRIAASASEARERLRRTARCRA